MTRTAPRWIRQVPNALSGLRLVLAVAFPWLPPNGRLPAVVASGATDWLDGLIARRYGVQSVFGGLLDATVLVTALYFAVRREWAAFGGMPARGLGKLTTLLVFAWLVVVLLPGLEVVRAPLFVLVTVASVGAAADYLVRFARTLAGRTDR